ncbi:MAG: hypothetical protein L0099_03200 [Acidobacteria bacterium]|nr:hypothetical protein [Acidobacteriota bacterium]
MLEEDLVPAKTVVDANGDGAPVEISAAGHRVFLLTLAITNIVEQEALDVSIQGSADGVTFDKPLAKFPQKFYRGEHPLLLHLTAQPDIKFVRAHWEVNRWGRGSLTPMFEFHLTLKEVPKNLLQETATAARA